MENEFKTLMNDEWYDTVAGIVSRLVCHLDINSQTLFSNVVK